MSEPETLPPEMLPRQSGDVLVCVGDPCDGDGPCALCLAIDPASDLEVLLQPSTH